MERYVRTAGGFKVAMSNLKLIFIGDANWDLYECDGTVWSIPKPEHTDCKTTWFGNRDHLLRLMRENIELGEITEDGLNFLSGLHNRLMDGWTLLSFAKN